MRVDDSQQDLPAVGEAVTRVFAFSADAVTAFATTIDDFSPVHFDADFARERGFEDRIVHGFLVSSVFSGMLGSKLPGPFSVINQLTIKLHKPVLVDQAILYQVAVAQVSPAARAVVLSLSAKREADGESVISGTAICSLPGATPQSGGR